MPYSTLRPLKGFDDHATWRLRTRLWHNKKSWTQGALNLIPGWTSQRNQNVRRTESEVVFIPEKVVFFSLCQDPERDTHTFP